MCLCMYVCPHSGNFRREGAIFVAFVGINLLSDSTKIVQCRMGMIACAREYHT